MTKITVISNLITDIIQLILKLSLFTHHMTSFAILTEPICSRYDHLNTSIMSRGKQLHSGMNSLSSFQPAADRFCSWLSEVESNIEILEASGEKLRIKYKDKQIPDTELVKFKVRL